MNPNQPIQSNPNQPSPQNGNGLPVSDIYPNNSNSPPPSASYLPVGQSADNVRTPEPYTEKKHRDHSGLRGVISTILLLAIAPLIAFGITSYIIQSYQV